MLVGGASVSSSWEGALGAWFGGLQGGLGDKPVEAPRSWRIEMEWPGPVATCVPARSILDDIAGPLTSVAVQSDLAPSDRSLCETLTAIGVEASECSPDTTVTGIRRLDGACGSAGLPCTDLVVETVSGRIPGSNGRWQEVQVEFAGADGSTTVCWDRFLGGRRTVGCQTLGGSSGEVELPSAALPVPGAGWFGIVDCGVEGGGLEMAGAIATTYGLRGTDSIMSDLSSGYLSPDGCAPRGDPVSLSIWLFFADETGGTSVRIDLTDQLGAGVFDRFSGKGIWTVEIQEAGFSEQE